MVNILERVTLAMQDDSDSNPERDSVRITEVYAAASVETKAAIDSVFVALCGWSLDSILSGNDHCEWEPATDVDWAKFVGEEGPTK